MSKNKGKGKGKGGKSSLVATGVIARNKAARHKYHILDTHEAGIVLVGSEVKALRAREATLGDAYAFIKNDEVWLLKAYVPPYDYSVHGGHEPYRPRKLLMHKREIRKLKQQVAEKGVTLVPLEFYFNERGIAKVRLAVVRGKKLHDKRESLKKKDHDREMRSARRR